MALEPCGHNACAACLSHHLAALLASGQPLACPLRCAAPERVVINTAVRQLVAARRGSGGPGGSPQASPSWRPQQPGSSLEQVPELAPEGGASESSAAASMAASGSGLNLQPGSITASASMAASVSGSQGLQAAAAALLPPASSAAGAEPALAPAAAPAGPAGIEAFGSQGSDSLADEWRGALGSPSSPGGSAVASPPPSPFQSLRNSRFSSLRSGELDSAAAAAVEQAGALAGAPTLAAAHPLGRLASSAAPAGASSTSVHSPAAPAGGATALGATPFDRALSLQQQQQAAASLAAAASSVGSSPAASPAAAAAAAASGGATLLAEVAAAMSPVHPGQPPSPHRASLGHDDSASSATSSSAAAAPRSPGGRPAPGNGTVASTAVAAASAPAAPAGPGLLGRFESGLSEGGASSALPMHPLCPLHDELLPLDTSGLKSRQLSHALEALRAARDDGAAPRPGGGAPPAAASACGLAARLSVHLPPQPMACAQGQGLGSSDPPFTAPAPHYPCTDAVMAQLEAIARLAWGDEAARDELGERRGLEAIVSCMRDVRLAR